MLYKDNKGRIMSEDEIDELQPHEIEELGVHIYEDNWV